MTSGNKMKTININEEKAMNNWEDMKKQNRREDIFMVLVIVAILATVIGIFGYFVNSNIRLRQEEAAAAHSQAVRQAEWVANSDYNEVAQQLETFLEEKYQAENNTHHGIGRIKTRQEEGSLEETANCTAWKWKGKVYTAQHCVTDNYRESMGDVAVEADKYEHDIQGDLFDIGTECSPDFRWWGKTTNMWGHIPSEQMFNHYLRGYPSVAQQNDMRWAFIDSRKALEDVSLKNPEDVFKKLVNTYKSYMASASYQRFICAANISLEIFPDHGDSGGPLMAGDEVIGFVSYAESPRRSELATGTAEDFEVKYKDALYIGRTECWGSLDRSQDKPNLTYTEENMERYKDFYEQFVLKFGQETVSKWEGSK